MSNRTSQTSFTKMHGAGNDFVVLDAIRDPMPEDLSAFSRRISHRQFGIGADQILVVRDSQEADFRMEIFNADGSQVEMCANGIRAFYKFLRDHGHTDADEISVETLSGVVRPRWVGSWVGSRAGSSAGADQAGADMIRVDMGLPVLEPAKIPTTLGDGDGPVLDVELDVRLEGAGERVTLSSVSMGNPHAVVVVDDVDTARVHELGSAIENHPAFPNRVNIEFIELVDRTRFRQRTWERGTGETLACGSGACAAAVVSMLRGVVDRRVVVELRGGELEIAWADDRSPVLMTGPAREVFSGTISLEEE
jgi:diaminopimelate epimerase